MSKRDTQQTRTDVRNDRTETSNQYGGLQAGSQGRLENTDIPNVETGRAELKDKYSNLAPAGTLNTQKLDTSGSVNPGNLNPEILGLGGKLGSIKTDTSNFASPLSGYKELSSSGGYSPDRQASIMQNIQGLKNFGNTGGIDQTGTDRIRGMGGFDEFAKTGGYSSADKANIQAKALSPIGANLQATNDELARRRNVQGGYAPGFDSASRAMRRDASRNIADTSLDANLGIMDRVNQGRQWGIGGMSNAETGLQNLKTNNMYRGMMGAGNQEMDLQNNINSTRLAGLGGATGIANNLADNSYRTAMANNDNSRFNILNSQDVGKFNIGNQMDAGRFNIGNNMNAQQFNLNRGDNLGLQNANLANDTGKFNINNAQNVQMAGLGGLSGIYGSDVDQYGNELNRQTGLTGAQAGANQGYFSPETNLSTQPGVGGNIIKGIGAAAGVGSAMFNPVPKKYGPGY